MQTAISRGNFKTHRQNEPPDAEPYDTCCTEVQTDALFAAAPEFQFVAVVGDVPTAEKPQPRIRRRISRPTRISGSATVHTVSIMKCHKCRIFTSITRPCSCLVNSC